MRLLWLLMRFVGKMTILNFGLMFSQRCIKVIDSPVEEFKSVKNRLVYFVYCSLS